ncbi:glycosyltransferase [Candidatus Peregrinibacteria bacterium]|nr:glycosyltransferase [Candidatus Peregrinibacteria bacterium]
MKEKITLIITAYKEEKTIGAVIESVIKAIPEGEILVIAPDDGTLKVAKSYTDKHTGVVVLKDENKGKPAALNIAIKQCSGDIAMFTDGDVTLSDKSIKALAEKLTANTIATGRPVIVGERDNMLNWWGKTLFDIVNKMRRKSFADKKPFLISGYLWGMNYKNFKKIQLDENLVTEDEYLTYFAIAQKLDFVYVENAEVGIKYPQTISDWLKQKVRTLGGSYQIKQAMKVKTRSLFQESSDGLKVIFSYPKNFKQWIWLILLLFFRILAWIKAYFLIVILKKGKAVWARVESTK